MYKPTLVDEKTVVFHPPGYIMSMPPATVYVESHVLTHSYEGRRAQFAAKRYTTAPQESTSCVPIPNYTLVFAHALGFHKECWEPTISLLFDRSFEARRDEYSPVISQMWTVDCPDHGESAILNGELSGRRRFSCHWYASAIHALSQSGLLCDMGTSRLVLVGHSAGAIAATLATQFFKSTSLPSIVPHAVVLIEPWMIPPDLASSAHIVKMTSSLVSSTELRRDVWGSLDEARAYFRSKRVWQAWDPAVLSLYTIYCLKRRASSCQSTDTSVTLTYPKSLECEGYGDLSEGQAALAQLGSVSCATTPVHIIFGTGQGSVAQEVQRAICSPDAGRRVASVTALPNVGHMAPQQSPSQISAAIWDILVGMSTRGRRGVRAWKL